MTVRRLVIIGLALVALVVPFAMRSTAGDKSLTASLIGLSEVPSVSTGGGGTFAARILGSGDIAFTLSYQGLEGSVQQAHIHFAQAGVNGGISVFLCTNLGNGPAGTQPCPAGPTTISGTIGATDVIGPAGQGISAGELNELKAAIAVGATYANVHSTLFPGGEIRGQIK